MKYQNKIIVNLNYIETDYALQWAFAKDNAIDKIILSPRTTLSINEYEHDVINDLEQIIKLNNISFFYLPVLFSNFDYQKEADFTKLNEHFRKISEIAKKLKIEYLLWELPVLNQNMLNLAPFIKILNQFINTIQKNKIKLIFKRNKENSSSVVLNILMHLRNQNFNLFFEPIIPIALKESISSSFQIFHKFINVVNITDYDKENQPTIIGDGLIRINEISKKIMVNKNNCYILYDADLSNLISKINKHHETNKNKIKKFFTKKNKKLQNEKIANVICLSQSDVCHEKVLLKQLDIVNKIIHKEHHV